MTAIWIAALTFTYFHFRFKRQKQRVHVVTTTQLTDAADMLAILLLSGLSTPQAFLQLHRYLEEPFRSIVHDCGQLLTHGSRFHDVVRQLHATTGHAAFAFCETLLASERDGLAIGPILERLSYVSHQQRRQEREAEARQLPIRMAFPLVGCVLPSFVLLGVVPLFAGSLGGLGAHI